MTQNAPLSRRNILLAALTTLSPQAKLAQAFNLDPTYQLAFPRDFGAHPQARIEWWYLTGWLYPAPEARVPTASQAVTAQPTWGFQITFFRNRTDLGQKSASQFAPQQLIFAHAALTDLQAQQLHHDQRIARMGFGLAEASEQDTQLNLRNWRLARTGSLQQSVYDGHIEAPRFTLTLQAQQTQPILLQGLHGWSRKGPEPHQASYYYSQPQLLVQGSLQYQGKTTHVQGRGWLDHEWSETLLDPAVVGWDWIGMNLLDGSTLTAFRLRRADGSTIWSGGSLRKPQQAPEYFQPNQVHWEPVRIWTSPATQGRYPVEWLLHLPLGRRYKIKAYMDAQELDSRASTGSIYWEGLSQLGDEHDQLIGRGYLEMTGYVQPLSL